MERGHFAVQSRAERFEALAAPQEKRVYAVCYHMMGNREDAMDCAQEAMLKAFRAFDSFRGEAGFATWLTRIAVNTCTDALRKRSNVVSLDAMREDTGFDVPDEEPSPYTQMEAAERRRLLREGMEALPPEMRQMIVLRDVEGMRYEEVAQAMQVPLGTVKSRISRAREKLSGILRKSSELFSSQSV